MTNEQMVSKLFHRYRNGLLDSGHPADEVSVMSIEYLTWLETLKHEDLVIELEFEENK